MEITKERLFLVIAAIVILVGGSLAVAQNAVATYNTASMPLGNASCTVELGIIAMKDGVVVNSPILNNPLYLDGVEVDSLQFPVKVTATGSDVDWSTLTVTLVLLVNDQHLQSWDWTILDFSGITDGYEASSSYTVTELDYLVGVVPDRIEDNIGYYTIEGTADAFGAIQDTAGNALMDAVKVVNSWELSDAAKATPDPLVVPEFTSVPSDMTVNYGDAFTFSWTPKDDNPSTFKITSYYLDGGSSTEQTGYWVSQQAIIITGNALYASLDPAINSVSINFVCFVYDDDGQSEFSSVHLIVNSPASTPVDPFTWSKATFTPSGTVVPKEYEVVIAFKPSATHTPESYIIYLNGIQKDAGSWSGGDIPFVLAVDIQAGTSYNFECKVWDTYGNSDSYTVTIKGEASTLPPIGNGDDPDDPIINSPFYIEALGEGGTILFYIIIGAIPIVYLYRRRMED